MSSPASETPASSSPPAPALPSPSALEGGTAVTAAKGRHSAVVASVDKRSAAAVVAKKSLFVKFWEIVRL